MPRKSLAVPGIILVPLTGTSNLLGQLPVEARQLPGSWLCPHQALCTNLLPVSLVKELNTKQQTSRPTCTASGVHLYTLTSLVQQTRKEPGKVIPTYVRCFFFNDIIWATDIFTVYLPSSCSYSFLKLFFTFWNLNIIILKDEKYQMLEAEIIYQDIQGLWRVGKIHCYINVPLN